MTNFGVAVERGYHFLDIRPNIHLITIYDTGVTIQLLSKKIVTLTILNIWP